MQLLLAALAFVTSPFLPSSEQPPRPMFVQSNETGDCCYSCSYCCGYFGCGTCLLGLGDASDGSIEGAVVELAPLLERSRAAMAY